MTRASQAQPELGNRSKKIIDADGLQFRDLDGDGQLTPYEDWRLPAAERAKDLVGRMSLPEKAGMMIIGSHFMGDSKSLKNPVEGALVNEQDVVAEEDFITGATHPEPVLSSSGATAGILQRHQRHFIVRDNPSATRLAEWTNALQEIAESSEHGIPLVFASNPRNHVSLYVSVGVAEGSGVFSEWPAELGLAALRDPDLVRQFAEIARREWRASGIHKLYGYMADVASEARWTRFNGTFGEDVELVTAYIRELVEGLQGEDGLNNESVATTIKHFPGGSVRTDGHDPHFPWGQTNDYPTADSLEKYHLPPFRAAVDAGTASMMPYYAKPVNTSADVMPKELWIDEETQFDEVAFAYNKPIIQGLLRGKLGFTGYVNSDSGIIDTMVWGVEDLSREQRWAKAVETGVNIVSDVSDPAPLIRSVEQGLLDEKYVDQSVELLLIEMFELGLFENPYVDPAEAQRIADLPESQALGDEAQKRSITLLRNDQGLLPLSDDALDGIWLEVFAGDQSAELTASLREAFEAAGVRPAASLEDAKAAAIWVRPVSDLFAEKPDRELSIAPGDNSVDVARVIEIQKAVPTATVVNFGCPWLLDEIEPNAAALVGTYEVTPDNLLEVLRGRFEPTGVLPFAVPRDAATAAASPRDVPGALCGPDYPYVDSAGNTYQMGFRVGFDGKPAN